MLVFPVITGKFACQKRSSTTPTLNLSSHLSSVQDKLRSANPFYSACCRIFFISSIILHLGLHGKSFCLYLHLWSLVQILGDSVEFLRTHIPQKRLRRTTASTLTMMSVCMMLGCSLRKLKWPNWCNPLFGGFPGFDGFPTFSKVHVYVCFA